MAGHCGPAVFSEGGLQGVAAEFGALFGQWRFLLHVVLLK